MSIICPKAIAYSMGHPFGSVSVSDRLRALLWSHFFINFHQIGTDVRTPQKKNTFIMGQYRTTLSPISPPKTSILGQEVLKTHANIK